MPFQLDSPRKRQRRDSNDSALEPEALVGQSTNFRNISACSRCRSRKNRCDQRLPSCSGCAKAGVACVGYDVLTKRETPRRYAWAQHREEAIANSIAMCITSRSG